jgi:hypothetical protein
MALIKKIPYIGKAAYCYADSTSMLLASIGENIPPSKIEVLSGVGLGANILKGTNLLFFNWEVPDYGIDNALKILGFKSSRKKTPKSQPPPLEKLKKDLEKSPIVVGPLDMGYLTYNPLYSFLAGVDHFVLIYKITREEIFFHDPAGFPHVCLPLPQFKLSWKAKKIFYGKDNFSYWVAPKRLSRPSDKEIYQAAVKLFQWLYRNCDKRTKKESWITGKEAILTTAKRARERRLTKIEIEQLVYFAFQLGAIRALDFASFFDFKDNDLAQLKRQQAEIFGNCHTFTSASNWLALARELEELAKIEERIKQRLFKK